MIELVKQMDVMELRNFIDEATEIANVKEKEALAEVVTEKKGAGVYLTYNGMTIKCKRDAYEGRYRVYEMVAGKNGKLKQGEVILKEVFGGIRDIKQQFRFNGHYRINFNDKTTWEK
jgi:hypothetical protein